MKRRAEPLLMRVFRQEPGDLGIPDRPALPDVEDAVRATKEHLESYLPQENTLGRRLPTRAQLFSYDGTVLADFRLTHFGAEPVLRNG